MKKLVVICALLLSAGIAPSVFAQSLDSPLPDPGILPDSPFFILKALGEQLKGAFVFGEDNKALYAISLSYKRLSELTALVDAGKDGRASQVAEQASVENEKAQNHLENAASQGKDVTAIVNLLIANSQRQQDVLAKVLAKVPAQARAAIQRAIERSRLGLLKAQEMQMKERGKPETTGKPSGVVGQPTVSGKPSITGKPILTISPSAAVRPSVSVGRP